MIFKIYKHGQGKYTRLYSALGLGVIVAAGCWRLYEKLGGLNISTNASKWVQNLVPAVLFAILGYLTFWLVNNRSVADFMISAEGELKKVNWTSRKEVVVSTFIVICVVIFMASLLGVTDVVFQLFFDSIGLGR